jgi:hypothetical protein
MPDSWRIGEATVDSGTWQWSITARGLHPGRGKAPKTITGAGEDEIAAMVDLRIRLDERRKGGS